MKAFVSWSGGKDCTLALNRYLKNNSKTDVCLLNMCDAHSDQSRSHGLHKDMIALQAQKMGIALFQQPTDAAGYEKAFKTQISELKTLGVTVGVFGDIYLMEHRTWIERVCNEMQIEAIFPLWEVNTKTLFQEFIDEGFKALTVSVRCNMLPQSWLGRELNADFLTDICQIPNADPCAENGEYHSFVYDGPLYSEPVLFDKSSISEHDNHYFLTILAHKS